MRWFVDAWNIWCSKYILHQNPSCWYFTFQYNMLLRINHAEILTTAGLSEHHGVLSFRSCDVHSMRAWLMKISKTDSWINILNVGITFCFWAWIKWHQQIQCHRINIVICKSSCFSTGVKLWNKKNNIMKKSSMNRIRVLQPEIRFL